MYHEDTELLFPPRAIPALKGMRSPAWDKLIEQAEAAGETSLEKVAFVLMMARLNGCASCNSDSFRAMHGCVQCSKQTITRFHGSDKELLGLHKASKEEIQVFKNQ